MSVTEKQLVERCFSKCCSTYNEQAIVQKEVAIKINNLLSVYTNRNFNRVLEVGCGTGMLTSLILNNYNISEYILNDLVDSGINDIYTRLQDNLLKKCSFIKGDAEKIIFPSGIDAVLSASCFQWFNNLDLFIRRMNYVLESKGILAFSTYGESNFEEIRTILNVGLNYLTLSEHKEIISRNFEIIHSEEWRQTLQFNNPNEVLRHIKNTGVNGLGYGFFGKSDLARYSAEYKKLYECDESKVRLTYHPIIIIAQKKN